MLSKKEIKEYGFENVNEYIEYIIDSEINGQRSQVRKLIKKLSSKQKKDALSYIELTYESCNGFDMELTKEAKTVYDLILESI